MLINTQSTNLVSLHFGSLKEFSTIRGGSKGWIKCPGIPRLEQPTKKNYHRNTWIAKSRPALQCTPRDKKSEKNCGAANSKNDEIFPFSRLAGFLVFRTLYDILPLNVREYRLALYRCRFQFILSHLQRFGQTQKNKKIDQCVTVWWLDYYQAPCPM